MAGRVIGSAYVRIRALTDQIEDDIKKALGNSDSAIQDLGKSISDSIGDAVKEEIQETKKELEKAFDEISKERTLDIDVNVNEDSVDAFGRRVKDMLDDLDTDIDLSVSEESLREMSRDIDRQLDSVVVEVELELDRQNINKIKDKFDELKNDIEDNEIEVHSSISEPWYRRVQARLITLTRPRDVSIQPEIDNAAYAKVVTAIAALSGGRLLAETTDNILDIARNLDKTLPKFALVTQAVGGLSALILATISNLSSLAGGLVQALGAGLALPGIVAGLAVGLGSTIAVLKDFNIYMPEIAEHFKSLQSTMSGNFWSVFETPMRNMSETLFPEFASGILLTTGALAQYFSALANSLREHLGGSMAGMFSNLSQSILISATHTDSLARIVETLGRKGSEYLPRLASWAGDIADKFAEWLSVADKSGKLDRWIQTGIQRLGELRRILQFTGEILWDIIDAANQAGGSQLAVLADTLEKIAGITGSEPFKSQMVLVFTAAHDAMNSIATVSGPAVSKLFESLPGTIAESLRIIGVTIGELVAGISEAFSTPEFDNGLNLMLLGIRDAIIELQPMWTPLGEGLGAVGIIIGDLAKNFGPLLATLLTAISEIAVTLQPFISELSAALSEALASALAIALPLIQRVLEILVNLLTPLADSALLVGALGIAFTKLKVDAVIAGIQTVIWHLANLKTSIGVAALEFADKWKKMGAITKGGVIAAAIGAIALGLQAVWEAAGDVGVAATDVSHFERSIRDLSVGGGESLSRLNDEFSGVSSGWYTLSTMTGTGWMETLKHGVDESAESVTGLSDALSLTSEWADKDIFNKLIGGGEASKGFFQHSNALNQSIDSLKNFDTAAASVVRSGSQEEIAALMAYVAEQAEISGVSVEDLARDLPEYGRATEEYAISQERLAEAAALSAVEVIKYTSAISEMNGLTPNMISLINEASKEFITMSDGLTVLDDDMKEVTNSVEGWISTLEQQVKDQTAWADNMALLSGKVSEGVLQELARLGPEGAPMVAKLTTASDEELARLEEVFRMKTEGAVGAADSEFGKMAGNLATQMAGINLATIDPSGKLEATFKELGFTVNDGFITGVSEGDPAAGAAGVFANINLADLDPSGKLQATFEELGYIITDGFITGFEAPDVKGKMNAMLDGSAPTSISPALAGRLSSLGVSIPGHITVGASTGDATISAALTNMMMGVAMPEATPAQIASLNELGLQIVNGVVVGIESGSGEGGGLSSASGGIVGTVLNSLNTGFDTHSPSKVTETIGGYVVDGLIIGLGSKDEGVSIAGQGIVDTLLGIFNINSVTPMIEAGVGFASNLLGGLNSQIQPVTKGGVTLSQSLKSGIGSVSTTDEGTRMGRETSGGLLGMLNTVFGSGTTVARGAKQGLGTESGTAPGETIAKQFSAGVGSIESIASSNAKTLSKAVSSGFEFEDVALPGRRVAEKFANSMLGSMEFIKGVARSLGTAAVNSLEDTNGAWNSGAAIGNEFAAGLRATTTNVRNAAKGLAAAARASLPNSPAKEGPFSGSGWGGWGESISEELASGLVKGTSLVSNASSTMMGAVDLSASPTIGSRLAQSATTPSAPDNGIIGGGNSVVYNIEVQANVSDLKGIADLEEFIMKANVWKRQGRSGQ